MSTMPNPALAPKFTSADLLLMPDDGKLYEVIEGELYVAKQPHWHHQFACGQLFRFLQAWSEQSTLGMANGAPGVIFAEDDDVAPDVVWISYSRLTQALGGDGKLHAAPELAIEVLSPGWSNQHRDRQAKLKLYSRRGVQEYWLVDWEKPQVEVYRRENDQLVQVSTLFHGDAITSPLLPGFSCDVSDLLHQIPKPGQP
ncbi:MAG: Uma2 family endonuclease [Acidobacteriota bacterium]|nr:Uma2 family endonuclease [Acidobacteriota bacterium]